MANQVTPVELPSRATSVARVLPLVETLLLPRTQNRPARTRWSLPVPMSVPRERLELGGGLIEAHVQFVFDENSQLVQVRVIDTATNRILREIPPQALAELAAALRAYQDVGFAARDAGRSGG